MHHGTEFTVVIIATLALLVGVATRLLSSWTRFPYTIAMLLLGIAGGLALEHGSAAGEQPMLLDLLAHGAHASPHLIIFVFLPALLFESAYAIDVHVFKNNLGAVVLLAVPALVLATGLTAALMVGLLSGSWAWGWVPALVFGALISATDPVAVVAILRELGVSKRLAVLIEGESLFNDGTAIVVFSVLVAMLTGEAPEFHAGDSMLRFAWVVSGGVGVGLLLAFVVSAWLEKLFNDPLAEITLTIVLAYSAMIIAEGLLHVSGVMAVVTTGLWMSSAGKTKISPEVSHFLHRFWELLGYIANTLIFFLVGIVIAKELEMIRAKDVLLILGTYVGVMAIRFLLTYGFRSLADRWSDGVSSKDAAVMSWGGLRGAVSLALALVVSQNELVPAPLGRQILLMTAGVVLLTIVVNGTTIAKLLSFLGYDKPQLSALVQHLGVRKLVLDEVLEALEEARQRPELRTCRWNEVFEELSKRRAELEAELASANERLQKAPSAEREVAIWRRVLTLEVQGYWLSYNSGTLSASATRLLVREINRQLDRIARGDCTPAESRLPKNALRGWFWVRWFGGDQRDFERLRLRFDASRAEAAAARRVLDSLHAFQGADPNLLQQIQATYERYLLDAKERVEDLRTNLPEVASAMETRLARRIELNLEREGYERLAHDGILNETSLHEALHEIEHTMALLKRSPTRVPIPETADLVANTPMFSGLDESALKELAELTKELVIAAGETIFVEGDKGDSMFVIARGAVQVFKDVGGKELLVGVLGGGEIIGEMALLTGQPRTATAKAKTAVTLGKLSRSGFEHLMQSQPTLRQSIWDEFSWRRFDNELRALGSFQYLERRQRRHWLEAGEQVLAEPGHRHVLQPGQALFVATGDVEVDGKVRTAPCLIQGREVRVAASSAGRWVVLGPPPAPTRSTVRSSEPPVSSLLVAE